MFGLADVYEYTLSVRLSAAFMLMLSEPFVFVGAASSSGVTPLLFHWRILKDEMRATRSGFFSGVEPPANAG